MGGSHAGDYDVLEPWMGVFSELEHMTSDIEDVSLASLHVSLLSTVATLLAAAARAHTPDAALPSPHAPSVLGVDAPRRLGEVAERCVGLVYPLEMLGGVEHLLSLDASVLEPHMAALSLDISGIGSKGPVHTAYAFLMATALCLLPAGRALELAEGFLRVAAAGGASRGGQGGQKGGKGRDRGHDVSWVPGVSSGQKRRIERDKGEGGEGEVGGEASGTRGAEAKAV